MPVKIRPSSAGKWVNCPGSAKLEDGRPEGDTSFADEGTVAHWIAAKILKGEELPELGSQWEVENKEVVPVLVDSGLPAVTFTQEMLDHVRKYTEDVIDGTYAEYIHVEEHVKIFDNVEGTPDAFEYCKDAGVLYVHDLKYGFTQIDAKDNYQLLLYAYGILNEYPEWEPWQGIALIIHQPRLNRVDSYTYALGEFEEKIQFLKVKANGTQSENAEEWLYPGDHCAKYYCKARAICPALNKFVLADLPDMEEVQDDDIGTKLSKIPLIRAWCDAIEQEAYRVAVREGKPVRGYKVVQSRNGNRKWRSDQEAEQIMKSMRLRAEQMYKYSLISPTEAEKMFKQGTLGARKWKRLREVITRSESKLLLVPESDKREAVDVLTDLDLLDDLIGE